MMGMMTAFEMALADCNESNDTYFDDSTGGDNHDNDEDGSNDDGDDTYISLTKLFFSQFEWMSMSH